MLVPDLKLMLAVAVSVDEVYTLEAGDQGSSDFDIVVGQVLTTGVTSAAAPSL